MAFASTAYMSQALNSLDASGTPVNLAVYVSGHASPGPGSPNTGANEFPATGGYARQATAWSSSSGGTAKTNNSALSFSTPGTVSMTHFSTVSAVTAGTFGLGGAFTTAVLAATITIAAGALSLTAS